MTRIDFAAVLRPPLGPAMDDDDSLFFVGGLRCKSQANWNVKIGVRQLPKADRQTDIQTGTDPRPPRRSLTPLHLGFSQLKRLTLSERRETDVCKAVPRLTVGSDAQCAHPRRPRPPTVVRGAAACCERVSRVEVYSTWR